MSVFGSRNKEFSIKKTFVYKFGGGILKGFQHDVTVASPFPIQFQFSLPFTDTKTVTVTETAM